MTPPAPSRWFEVEQRGDVTILRLTACRLVDSRDTFGAQLSRMVDEGRRLLVLDFAAVERLDSGVLAQLVVLQRRLAAAGGRLALCGLSPRLGGTFRTLRLDRLLGVQATEAEALESVQGGRAGG